MSLTRIAKVINRNLNERTSLNSIAAKIASNLRKDANLQDMAERVEEFLSSDKRKQLLLMNSDLAAGGTAGGELEIIVSVARTSIHVSLMLPKTNDPDIDRKLRLLEKNTVNYLDINFKGTEFTATATSG